MLGSVVHDPVGASPPPSRPGSSHQPGRGSSGPRPSLCAQEYAVRQMRSALAVVTVSSRSAGRVFSLWACPPSPYRPRGRPRWASGAAFALLTYMAAVSAADVAIFDATWGCFWTIVSPRYVRSAWSFVHGVVFRRNPLPHSKRPTSPPLRPLIYRIIPLDTGAALGRSWPDRTGSMRTFAQA